MRVTKKFTSLLLAVLMVFSLCFISAGAAAPQAPVFELKVISETEKELVATFSSVSGSFSALDVSFIAGKEIAACKSIEKDPAFTKFSSESVNGGVTALTNPKTMKLSMVAPIEPLKYSGVLYKLTFTKASAAAVSKSAVKAVVTNCAVHTSAGNADITADAKVNTKYEYLSLGADLKLKYKDSANISLFSGCAVNNIKWTSSDEKVATVDKNGKVYASGRGEATITAVSPEGIRDTCNVKVDYTFGQWLIVIVLFGWIWY